VTDLKMEKYLEREVKFEVQDFAEILQRLDQNPKARLVRDWVDEKNFIFDDQSNSLREKEILLRLRIDDKVRLTVKEKCPKQDQAGIKCKLEYEVNVSDFATTKKILETLGFKVSLEYYKVRKVYRIKNTLICLDKLPFGNFVEIEGDNLVELARYLGLTWEQKITKNYLDLCQEKLNQDK